MRLFADRAAAVRPGLRGRRRHVAAVVEICRRLDGLPLAIELAAARLRTLTAEQVAARLDDRFRLLTGGSRTALPRHRTLRAVVEWSWDLLDDAGAAARAAGSRSSPAVRPPTRAAAVSPTRRRPPTCSDVLGGAGRQVAAAGRGRATGARYRMLETIREYGARASWPRAGELARGQARPRRATSCALVERAEPHLRTASQLTWLARLRAERDNLLAAVARACDTGDAETAFRLGAALRLVLDVRGQPRGGRRPGSGGPRGPR